MHKDGGREPVGPMQTLHRCDTWRVAVPIDRGFGIFLGQSFQPKSCQSGQLHGESVESGGRDGALRTPIAAKEMEHFERLHMSNNNESAVKKSLIHRKESSDGSAMFILNSTRVLYGEKKMEVQLTFKVDRAAEE